MEILAHRGWWLKREENNSRAAFARAFAAGLGVELDVRDLDGSLVVCHDLARSDPAASLLTLAELLAIWRHHREPGVLAINIKADGLAPWVAEHMRGFSRQQWFVFDMSVPDTLAQLQAGNPVFLRQSEVEPVTPLAAKAEGIWLDAFENPDWFDQGVLLEHIRAGRKVALVSPELHQHPFEETWHRWRAWCADLPKGSVLICTDHVAQAMTFFTGSHHG